LAGDSRLTDKLRCDDLLPLGSQIRYRLALSHASSEELETCLRHLMKSAGNGNLMTAPLIHALCEHALGNYRVAHDHGRRASGRRRPARDSLSG
jgi:hypothetical protein